MLPHRIFQTSLASGYPLTLAKLEKKGRTIAGLDQVIEWLTGYDAAGLEAQLDARTTLEQFFAAAPALNPARAGITGMICGVRIEAIEEPLMREIRYLDKLVDKLAKGRAMGKVCREG